MPKRASKCYNDRRSAVFNLKTKQNKSTEEKTEATIVKISGTDDTEEHCETEESNELIVNRRFLNVKRYNQNNEIERLLMSSAMRLRVHLDHSEFPSFNQGLWPQINQDSLRVYPSCAFSIPRPIHTSKTPFQQIDICYKRPLRREAFKSKILRAKADYKKFTSCKKNKAAEKDGSYHRSIFDFAERVQTQSDPNFHGSYDYYYTGGNLCILPQSGNVVHASGERLHSLELSEFPTIDHYPASNYLTPISYLHTTEDSEIFEIKPMFTSSEISQRNCFIARQRNIISLNCLNDESELKVITQFRTKSTPFLSFAQSERNYGSLLITTMKQHIRFYDLSTNVPRLVKLFEIKPEKLNTSWNTIRPWRENTFLFANEYKFTFVDTRTTPDQWMASAILAIENNYVCDHISSVAQSNFNNLFYVGTNHRLHCMDVRQIKKNSFTDPHAVVCRWSHQLQYAPLLLETTRIRNTEYIALSSPLAGDLHVCQLNREKNSDDLVIKETHNLGKHIYRSACLPYQPPTLLDAYQYATLAGNCLQPEAKLGERLKACTTGLAFSKPSESDFALAELLTSNSLGDIFSCSLSKREGDEPDSRGNARSNELLNDFAKKLSETPLPLQYTEIKNLKSLRKIFLCPYLNADLKFDLDAMDDSYSETEVPGPKNVIPIIGKQVKKKRKRLHLGRWQKSFATLHSYKDALVSDLLSIWDIEMEDDNKNNDLFKSQSNLNKKTDPALKVRDWLNTNLCAEQPMISLPPNIVSEYRENYETKPFAPAILTDSIRNNDSLNNTDFNLTQTSLDFENAIQSTQVMETTIQFDATIMETKSQNVTTTSLDKSTKKKAKKYVKGF